jgi:agmatine deiminase
MNEPQATSLMKTPQMQKKEFPAALGFSMPAEWAPHEAAWLAWPHNVETWPGKRLAVVEEIYLQILEGLLAGEKVHLLVNDAKERDYILKRLSSRRQNTRNLLLREVPTVDAWIRDYGPTFIKDKSGKKAWNKWIFNAWGSKYESLMADTKVFEDSSLIPYPGFKLDIVLEGGSIEVNGEGTCLVTEQCLLNSNRNPGLSREKIEGYLRDYLGVEQILWIAEGIMGDDTDGHIDDIVRFTGPRTILSAFEDNTSDENYPILKDNWDRLESFSDKKGRKWELVKFPMPGKLMDGDVRLPASYANFLIANGIVLLPVFKHKNDERAVKILKELLPKHEIIPINCTDLVYGLGAIHCISQQEPA